MCFKGRQPTLGCTESEVPLSPLRRFKARNCMTEALRDFSDFENFSRSRVWKSSRLAFRRNLDVETLHTPTASVRLNLALPAAPERETLRSGDSQKAGAKKIGSATCAADRGLVD